MISHSRGTRENRQRRRAFFLSRASATKSESQLKSIKKHLSNARRRWSHTFGPALWQPEHCKLEMILIDALLNCARDKSLTTRRERRKSRMNFDLYLSQHTNRSDFIGSFVLVQFPYHKSTCSWTRPSCRECSKTWCSSLWAAEMLLPFVATLPRQCIWLAPSIFYFCQTACRWRVRPVCRLSNRWDTAPSARWTSTRRIRQHMLQ